VDSFLGRDLLVCLALSTGQHDPSPERERLRTLESARPPLEGLTLLIGEHELYLGRPGRAIAADKR